MVLRRDNSISVIILLLSLLTSMSSLLALPRYALENEYTCSLCHVDPAGGGMRNEYGVSVFGQGELVSQKYKHLSASDWDGFVGQHLRIGGDARFQAFSHADTINRKLAIFPMQADIYGELLVNSQISLYIEFDLSRKTESEFWTTIYFGNENWVRVGRAIPDYGLYFEDHTIFNRGGNLRLRKLDTATEGFFTSPFLKPPGMVELGFQLNESITISGSIGNKFIAGADAGYGFNEQIDQKYKSLNFDYYLNLFDKWSSFLGLNWLSEVDLSFFSISTGLNIDKLNWLLALDFGQNWNSSGTRAFSVVNQFNWKLQQGIFITASHQFYDPELEYLSGAIERFVMGMEFFPINVLEIKFQTRFTNITPNNGRRIMPEYLIQLHSWF